MTFEIEINGHRRAVRIEPVGGDSHRYRLSIDGAVREVDAWRVDPGTVSLILPDRGNQSREVGFSKGLEPGELTAYLHTGTIPVVVNGRRRRATAAAGGAGEQRITAPMPGRVLRVLVSPGDEVAAKQPLVVVEAMKMENELSAPRGGRVRDVAAREGASVEAGRLLVVVE